MRRWSGARLVAERELRERMRSRSFAVITVILLLAALAAVIVPALVGDDGPDTATVAVASDGPPGLAEAIAAAGRAQELEIAVRERPAAEAERAAAAGDVDAAVVGAEGSGPVRVSVKEDLSDRLRGAIYQAVAATRLRAGLADAGVPPERIDALTGPPRIAVRAAEPDTIEPGDVGVGVIAAVLLYVALLFAGTLVATGVAEEKTSRVSEVLLATLRPIELLVGKVAGIGLVSLLQLLVAAVPALVVALVIGSVDVPDATVPTIIAVVVWFAAGYALYASAYGALGALVGRQQEVGQVTAPLAILLLVGYLGAAFGAGDPEGALVRLMSLLPPFAPMVMPLRMATGTVGVGEVALALVLTLALAAAVLWFGARVYRGGITRTGARISLRQALGRSVG